MKNVVVIGGGTGLSSLLKGLKDIKNINLSAIVTVADDGGSTGKIRKEFKIPAVGDLRQVIVSLSENESILEKIMRYRFDNKDSQSLHGHSLGNLILTALIDIENDFYLGIEKIRDILNLKGEVYPIANDSEITLKANYTDKTSVIGESNIPNHNKKIESIEYVNHEKIKPNIMALRKIRESDLIVLSMGSLYTSLIANLIIPGVKESIIENSSAKIIYVSNIMTQRGETDGMTMYDHVKEIEKYIGYGKLDIVLVNNGKLNEEILKRYKDQNCFPIEIDSRIKNSHVELIAKNLVDSSVPYIRHDTKKIRKAFTNILNKI